MKDSFEFSESVKAVPKPDHMCSYDMVSLFINVPIIDTIEICVAALYECLDIPPPILDRGNFRELLLMVATGVEFSFNDIMYKQIDGVAMGSPLGSVLANIFVGYHKSLIPANDQLCLYSRFMADVYSHTSGIEEAVRFLGVLNGLHPALRFTWEHEQDSALQFLHVKVLCRQERDNVETTIYRKPTFTGLYTRWDSYSSKKYKIYVIKTLALIVIPEETVHVKSHMDLSCAQYA